MKGIKRLIGYGLLAVITTAVAPISAIAQSQNTAIVNVVNFTQSFDPNAGPASIVYDVTGPDAAQSVTLYFYKASESQSNMICNPLAQLYVGTVMEGNRTPGTYTTLWTGKTNQGAALASGLYCFQLRWSNPPIGTTPLREGLITILDSSQGAPSGKISASVDPSVINPEATEGNAAYISYTVNENLPTGFSLRIYDSGDVAVKTLIDTNQLISQGSTGTASWNGRKSNNQIVAPGDYRYKFRAGGQDLATGLIRVELGTSQGSGNGSITHYVTPVVIDPTAAPAQFATIFYTVNTSLNGLSVVIRNMNNQTVKMLASTNATVNPGNCFASITEGNCFATWDGKFFNGSAFVPVAEGIYRYAFVSSGSEIGSGLIAVDYGAVPGTGGTGGTGNAFISTHNAFPQTFAPAFGESTTISYTVAKPVSNFKLSIRNQSNSEVAALETTQTKGMGTYSFVWNGSCGATACPIGIYSYVFEAANETPVIATNALTISNVPSPSTLAITDLGPNPTIFNASAGDDTSLRFSINRDAFVDITILSGTVTVRNLIVATGPAFNAFANVTNVALWDGKNDNGQILPDGIYTYVIEAFVGNLVATPRVGTITISSVGGGTGGLMDVSNVYNDPNPFNPELQNTLVRFTLNQQANVTITITRVSDGAFIRTLAANQLFNAGTNQSVTWDGKDAGNNLVASGTYMIRVDASNAQFGSDTGFGNVTVIRGFPLSLTINDTGAIPPSFNPYLNQVTRADFTLNMTPSTLRARIFRTTNNAFIVELPIFTLGPNFYRIEWTGRDSNGGIVAEDTYSYRIEVTSGSQAVEATGTIFVTSDISGGDDDDVTPTGDCGNFNDVPKNHPLCDAIEFVKAHGIFIGYQDGSNTIGLENVIQRAELAASMQKAFQYELENYDPNVDGDLGYKDLKKKKDEWYMPYLKTFKNLGLMVGYPDDRVRPEKTMNTAELYLVFLKSALQSPMDVARFTIDSKVTHPPYGDTPINDDTRWYIKYSAFAKLNGLVTTKKFHPDNGITRGQVIKLVYDMFKKGLLVF